MSLTDHVPEARLFAIALTALSASVFLFAVSAFRLARARKKVPIRIHVGGTRGKSTTTRLIAAGLRAGGISTLGKATGSEPRWILPDGSERIVRRRGPASIREQESVLRLANRLRVQAIVVECMAVRPEFVFASEDQIIQATAAVITNARPDHFEEMGAAPQAAITSLAPIIPTRGRLIVGSEIAGAQLGQTARDRGTLIEAVETAGLSPETANRAIALAVCKLHGVAEAVALAGMEGAAADPGSYAEHAFDFSGKRLRFANAFACNDAQSLDALWQEAGGFADLVFLNARRDRPLRSRQFLDFVARASVPPLLFIAGDPLALLMARKAGIAIANVRALRARNGPAALRELAAAAPANGLIWGIGNYRGLGAEISLELRQNSLEPNRMAC